MAISVSDITSLRAGVRSRTIHINDDVGAVVVQDTSTLYGFVVNLATFSAGSEQTLATVGASVADNFDARRAAADKFMLTYALSGGGQDFCTVARSGNTLTPATPLNILFDTYSVVCLGVNDNGDKALSDAAINLGNGTYDRFTISGSTITQSHQAAASDAAGTRRTYGLAFFPGTDIALDCHHLDTDEDITFQCIDLASSISQGSNDDSGLDSAIATINQQRAMALAPLTSTKMVAFLPLSGPQYSLFTINRSGTSISGYGSPLNVAAVSGSGVVCAISSTRVLAAWIDASDDINIEAYTISGDTITADGISTTVARTAANLGGISVCGTDTALISWSEGGNVYTAKVSGFNAAPAGRFFYDTNGLTYRSDLPFTVATPSVMTIRGDNYAALGGAAAGSGGEIVILGVDGNNYATWDDFTESLEGAPINALWWINGEAL